MTISYWQFCAFVTVAAVTSFALGILFCFALIWKYFWPKIKSIEKKLTLGSQDFRSLAETFDKLKDQFPPGLFSPFK